MYACPICGDYLTWDNDLQEYICTLCLNEVKKDEVEEKCLLQQPCEDYQCLLH